MFTDFCCSLFLSLALSESGHFSLNVNGFQVWWAEAACTESGNGAGSFVSKRCHIFAARATGLDPPPSTAHVPDSFIGLFPHRLFSPLPEYPGSRAHALNVLSTPEALISVVWGMAWMWGIFKAPLAVWMCSRG